MCNCRYSPKFKNEADFFAKKRVFTTITALSEDCVFLFPDIATIMHSALWHILFRPLSYRHNATRSAKLYRKRFKSTHPSFLTDFKIWRRRFSTPVSNFGHIKSFKQKATNKISEKMQSPKSVCEYRQRSLKKRKLPSKCSSLAQQFYFLLNKILPEETHGSQSVYRKWLIEMINPFWSATEPVLSGQPEVRCSRDSFIIVFCHL